MWQKYIVLAILLGVIGFSSFKVNQHKDDKDKTNLAIYSSVVGVSSAFVLYLFYTFFVHVSAKDKVIDAVLNDFLKINEV